MDWKYPPHYNSTMEDSFPIVRNVEAGVSGGRGRTAVNYSKGRDTNNYPYNNRERNYDQDQEAESISSENDSWQWTIPAAGVASRLQKLAGIARNVPPPQLQRSAGPYNDGFQNRIKRDYGEKASGSAKISPWAQDFQSNRDSSQQQQYSDSYNDEYEEYEEYDDDPPKCERSYEDAASGNVNRWQWETPNRGFQNDRKPPQQYTDSYNDNAPQYREQEARVNVNSGPLEDFGNDRIPRQPNPESINGGSYNNRNKRSFEETTRANMGISPWQQNTEEFQNDGTPRQPNPKTRNGGSYNNRNKRNFEETTRANMSINPWQENSEDFGNDRIPRQPNPEPTTGGGSYNRKKRSFGETESLSMNSNPWQEATGGFPTDRIPRQPSRDFNRDDSPHNRNKRRNVETASVNVSNNPWTWEGSENFQRLQQQNVPDKNPWDWNGGRPFDTQLEDDPDKDRQYVRISRSPAQKISVEPERLNDTLPTRNFGDYDPVRPRHLPKSAAFRSHLSSKDVDRRLIYKGISEQEIENRQQQVPQEENQGGDWRKELDAKYDATYGSGSRCSSSFSNPGKSTHGHATAGDENYGGGGGDWRKELDAKYDATFGTEPGFFIDRQGSPSVSNTDFAKEKNHKTVDKGDDDGENWRKELDAKYDAKYGTATLEEEDDETATAFKVFS